MSSRNVLNAQEVARFVDDLAQQTARPELQRWLRGPARRWILRHYDLADRILRDPALGTFVLVRPDSPDSIDDVVPRSFGGEVPAWCAAALERGDEVVVLRLGASLRKRLTRVTALLEAELRQGSLTSLERLTFETAEARLRKSRRDVYTARRRAAIARGAVPVFRTASGADVVRLTSPESLADEGSRMHHCVGGYGYPEAVARGSCEIYSLRDRDGRPRATLEVEKGQVWQAKGFANGTLGRRSGWYCAPSSAGAGYEVRDDRYNLVLRRYDFRCKVQELDHRLRADGGLALLRENRTADLASPAHAEVKTLLCQVIANAGRLGAGDLGLPLRGGLAGPRPGPALAPTAQPQPLWHRAQSLRRGAAAAAAEPGEIPRLPRLCVGARVSEPAASGRRRSDEPRPGGARSAVRPGAAPRRRRPAEPAVGLPGGPSWRMAGSTSRPCAPGVTRHCAAG